MMTFKDEWEATLDELETESANLLVCFVVASSISSKLKFIGFHVIQENLQSSAFLVASFLKEQLDGVGIELSKLFEKIERDCCCCSPIPFRRLTLELENAMRDKKTIELSSDSSTDSSSDNNSADTDTDVNVAIRY